METQSFRWILFRRRSCHIFSHSNPRKNTPLLLWSYNHGWSIPTGYWVQYRIYSRIVNEESKRGCFNDWLGRSVSTTVFIVLVMIPSSGVLFLCRLHLDVVSIELMLLSIWKATCFYGLFVLLQEYAVFVLPLFEMLSYGRWIWSFFCSWFSYILGCILLACHSQYPKVEYSFIPDGCHKCVYDHIRSFVSGAILLLYLGKQNGR